MSVLTLVRHGQASFFADDYDRLSALGEQQARLLGEYWGHQGLRFDEVYTGPRARQRQTAELTGAAYRQAGLDWPDPVVLADLDEYDLIGMAQRLVPELARGNADFARLTDRYRQSAEQADRLRNFQAMFETLLLHWQTATAPALDLESWPAFRQRVERAIRQMQGPHRPGRRVATFTSGGFIGSAAQWALAAPDRTALELNWRVRNGSLTEFVFTRDRFTLDSFNAVPHLADPELWTYR